MRCFIAFEFNFALSYVIRRVQAIEGGLKLNGTYQLLVYADNANMLWGSLHTIKKNMESVEIVSKEIRLDVNSDNTKYMTMSRDQNAGLVRNIKIGSRSFERAEEFKYL